MLTQSQEADRIASATAFLTRRGYTVMPPAGTSRLTVGCLTLDLDTRTVTLPNRIVTLTRREMQVFEHYVRGYPRAVPSTRVACAIWGSSDRHNQATLSVNVRYIRRKFGCPILTSRMTGSGGPGEYRLILPEAEGATA